MRVPASTSTHDDFFRRLVSVPTFWLKKRRWCERGHTSDSSKCLNSPSVGAAGARAAHAAVHAAASASSGRFGSSGAYGFTKSLPSLVSVKPHW